MFAYYRGLAVYLASTRRADVRLSAIEIEELNRGGRAAQLSRYMVFPRPTCAVPRERSWLVIVVDGRHVTARRRTRSCKGKIRVKMLAPLAYVEFEVSLHKSEC